MSWHSWQNLPILLYRQLKFIKFQQCIVLETIHTSTMEGKRNSEGRGSKRRQFPRRVGWLIKVFFSGGSKIGELLETTSWASVEQATVYQLFHFQKKTCCFRWWSFFNGDTQPSWKKITEIPGGWKFKGMGGLKHKYPACMWAVWIFFGTTHFQDKLVDVFLSFKS